MDGWACDVQPGEEVAQEAEVLSRRRAGCGRYGCAVAPSHLMTRSLPLQYIYTDIIYRFSYMTVHDLVG